MYFSNGMYWNKHNQKIAVKLEFCTVIQKEREVCEFAKFGNYLYSVYMYISDFRKHVLHLSN